MAVERVPPSTSALPSVRDRLVAGVLDVSILFCVGVALGVIAVFFPESDLVADSVIEGVIELLAITLGWLYYALMESSRYQATLGKVLMGLLVTDLKGNRVSFLRATVRYLAKWLSILTLLLGFLMAAFTTRRQALHDIVAGCLIVSRHA
jgi:uncharacterized RDD family membrane protein YckC